MDDAPAPTGSNEAPLAPSRDLKPIDRLVEIMRLLRSDRGCPWDREQTLESLKQYLIEECYEVLEAVDSGDRVHLQEELGDLLLQVVFQSQLCSEEGCFTFDDVAAGISDKLVRRHPHVFGSTEVDGSDDVLRNWEAIKKDEKKETRRSVADGIPRHLPALRRADKVQKKVARMGFDWDEVHQVVAKLEEEMAEVKAALAAGDPGAIRDELGDLLFSTVNLSRFLGHNAEELLDETIARFVRRFEAVEAKLHAAGKKVTDCDLAELDRYWEEVKAER